MPNTQTMTRQNQCGDTAAWCLLQKHKQQVAGLRLSDAFEKDPGRAQRFSLELQDLFVDFSKNLITDETRSLLLKLAAERELEQQIHELFAGGKVNKTEDRPALHTLLRAPEDYSLELDGVDLSRQAQDELGRMFAVVEALRTGQLKGAAGETISKVVNIGIGGSDLGPRLLSEALGEFQNGDIEVEFVANMDPFDIEQALARSTPNATLFVIVSKSFATPETLANANRAKTWLLRHACADPGKHFIAISENLDAARQFGVSEQRCFKIWDWVGGRYSVWSCAGLTAAAALGGHNFKRFLAGAHVVDRHFQTAELGKNIPAILGLIGIWHNNFFGLGGHAVAPYDQRLRSLPAYLNQLIMESNGKSATASGGATGVNTTPIIWGGVGTNAQHAFFQFLHQGPRATSIDFLLPLTSQHDAEQHELLAANCIAQGEALMRGRANPDEPHRRFEGNRPSTTILYKRLDPHTLGMLLALYEHKTFVEAAIWGINPFDQWGVELGKELAGQIAGELAAGQVVGSSHDASTASLMNKYLAERRRRGP